MLAGLDLASGQLFYRLRDRNLEHEAEAAEIFGIPDDVTQVGLLPVAYTTVDDFRPAPRTPVEEIAYADAWGALL